MDKIIQAKDVIIIDDKFWREFKNCGHCGAVSAEFKCGRCKGVKYCSKECQASSWKPKHKAQCALICEKIKEDARDRESFSNLCVITDEIFSKDSKYPILDTDPNMNIMVTDLVSFGDLEDAVRATVDRLPVGGTIVGTIHTVRHFHPGIYKCARVIPYKDHPPVFIYHHENIDPAKIIQQSYLMFGDFNNYYQKMINAINRYDWTHSSSWGVALSDVDESEEEDKWICGELMSLKEINPERYKELEILKKRRSNIYFASYENASVLKDCVKKECIKESKFGPSHYTVTSPLNEAPIAMAVEIEDPEWKFGKAFQDKFSEKYFALMTLSNLEFMYCMTEATYSYRNINDLYDKLIQRYPDKQFTTVKKTEFKFNMSDFEV